jgi:hypothetical protein
LSCLTIPPQLTCRQLLARVCYRKPFPSSRPAAEVNLASQRKFAGEHHCIVDSTTSSSDPISSQDCSAPFSIASLFIRVCHVVRCMLYVSVSLTLKGLRACTPEIFTSSVCDDLFVCVFHPQSIVVCIGVLTCRLLHKIFKGP